MKHKYMEAMSPINDAVERAAERLGVLVDQEAKQLIAEQGITIDNFQDSEEVKEILAGENIVMTIDLEDREVAIKLHRMIPLSEKRITRPRVIIKE